MAIDTEDKRRRALGAGRPGAILPSPSGDIDASDRAGMAGVYYAGGALEDYPDLPTITTITPLDDGLITRQTAAGTVRSVDLNEDDVYKIRLIHPLLTIAQRNILLNYYDVNRTLGFDYTPLTEPYTYLCRFDDQPEMQTNNEILFTFTVSLTVVRL